MTGASQKLSISELADRYIDQTRASKDAFKGELINSLKYKWSFEINRLAAFGLYQPESERFWELVERDAQHLVPTADYNDILTRAIRVITNPLVSAPALLTLGVTNRKYISSYAVTVAQEIVNLERDIEEASAPLRAELPSLANKLTELSLTATAGTVYCGGAGIGESDTPTLTLRWQPASEFFGAVEVVGQHSITIRYYNPQRLRDALETFQDKFIPMRELPSDWLKKAKWVCSYAGAAALKRNGMTTVDRDTFLCVSKMTTVGYNLVSREFVKLVNMLWGDEHQE